MLVLVDVSPRCFQVHAVLNEKPEYHLEVLVRFWKGLLVNWRSGAAAKCEVSTILFFESPVCTRDEKFVHDLELAATRCVYCRCLATIVLMIQICSSGNQ
jgi:hypothetical protein